MRVNCPTCKTPVDLDENAAGNLIRCRACGRSFVGPRELALKGRPHTLTSFSVPGLILLHFVTLGLFTVVHLGLMHDRFPRLRRSDPTGFIAVALSFIPGLNLIWFFFTFRRLCVRINEQRRFAGLAETAPQSIALVVPTLLLCGFAGTILPLTGWAVLGTTVSVLVPVFIAVLQASVNELAAAVVPSAADTSRPGSDHGCTDGRTDPLDRDRDLRPAGERGALAGTPADRDSGP